MFSSTEFYGLISKKKVMSCSLKVKERVNHWGMATGIAGRTWKKKPVEKWRPFGWYGRDML